MNFDDLASIDWTTFESTAQWARLLDDLLALAAQADSADRRDKLADGLDAFTNKSNSVDMDVIKKLDAAAGKAARALRLQNMGDNVNQLAADNPAFQAAVKDFNAVSAGLKKEASLLRAETLNAAIQTLTGTITSLNALSQVVNADDDAKIIAAAAQAVQSAQKLRALLEKPA